MRTLLQPVLAQQDEGGGDLFKLLLVLLFFLGPAIKRALDERKGTSGKKSPRPRKAPRPQQREPQPGQLTWKELLEGKVPTEAEAPQAPQAWRELLEADTVEQAPGPEPIGVGEPIGAGEPDIDSPEHWRPLVPETVLSDVSHEEELERVGGQAEERLFEADDALSSLPMGWGGRPLTEVAADTAVEGYESRQARSRRLLPRRGDWRRAIVLAEVLGPPLTARSSQSYPGPPAGWS